MSGFDLVPVEGGDPVHLPPGETVLGRGPFLGVSDKRVSRHHGLLENLKGQLRLKPTHVNPCFVQSSRTGDPRPLQRGSWHPLRHGDLFSLLPGQLLYEVVAVGGESDSTPRNSQMFEEEELPVPPEPDVEPPPPPPPPIGRERAAVLPQQEEAEKDRAPPVEAEADRSDVSPPAPRRRVLPAWMMAAVAAPNTSPSCGHKVQSPVKARKRPAAKKTETSSSEKKKKEEEELSEEEMPKKRSRKTCNEEEPSPAKTDVPRERPAVRLQSGSIRPEVSDESDGFVVEVDEEGGGGGGTAPADTNATTRSEDGRSASGRQTAGRAGSAGSDGGGASGPAPSTRGRTPCPYGKDCYRKNPVHFQECSHPGDTDYEEQEEEEADRPECPYGTDCYRKNPLHRKEYKHTKKPAYNTRTVPAKTAGADEDFSDDDSFIDDDDSEEAGDDADYVPPESDESGKEDIRELQKEARAFLKKRK